MFQECIGVVYDNVSYRATVQYILRQRRISSISTNELTSLLLLSSYSYTIYRQNLIGMLILRHLHDVPFHIHV